VTASSDGAPADKTPKKGNVPKRKYPDFSRAHSEDNILLSGDESGEWDDEVDNITAKIAAENAMELLAALNMEDPVEEVTELDYLLENIEGGEEGKADDDDAERGVAYDTLLVNAKTYTVPELKDVCRAIGISTTGNKKALFQRIRDSSSAFIDKINDDSFYYRKKKGEDVDLSLPRWVILNPEPAPSVDGVNMSRGAEEGFFGPTNTENAEGAPKFQYCCREEEKICRPSSPQRIEMKQSRRKGIFLQPL